MKTYYKIAFFSLIFIFNRISIAQICFTDTSFIIADGTAGFEYGDLNNDGNLDLIVGSRNTTDQSPGSQNIQKIVVHLGVGNGEFENAILYDVKEFLFSSNIIVNDFNGDGNLDAAMNGGEGILVAFGDGNGTFSHHKSFCADEPYYVVSNDFDGDGILDIASCNVYQNTVSILLGDGRGNFGMAKNFDVDKEEPLDIKSADFNNDGFPDLVMGSQHHKKTKIIVLLNDGKGNFDDLTKYDVSGQQDGVITADFNSDGNKDIATSGEGYLNIYIGDGSGQFNNHMVYNDIYAYGYLGVGDINGDCLLDIVIANVNGEVSGDNYIIYEGDGLGGFETPITYSSNHDGTSGVCIADFNNDNKSDLIFFHSNKDEIAIMLNCNEECYCTNTKDVQISCEDYIWIDGNTYSESNNTATHTLINNQGCDSVISLDLTIRPANEYYNIFLCKGDTINIYPSIKNGIYIWQDSSNSNSFEVIESGTYWVQTKSNGCLFTDNYTVIEENCELKFEMPNVFTPNNDGINDILIPINNSSQFEIINTVFYNRWGRKIFETDNGLIEWDGKDMNDGFYYYSVEYYQNGNNCKSSYYKGYVNLLR